MIVDAKNLILGRLASIVAQKAMLGEPVDIINCDQAIITGHRKVTIKKYTTRIHRGSRNTGPFFPKRSDRLVKRTIRGMLSYKKEAGKKALKRIKCYRDIPDDLKDKETTKLGRIDISKLEVMKYITVGDLCNQLGK